jgi:hypothetical protein
MISTAEFNPILELDLDPIKVKLMHTESGEGWTLEHANAMEFEYRRFLYLMKMFPKEQTAPLFDVDIFWHYHILDTMKYAADCEHIFGYFLHHFPYIGLRGEDDEAAHHRIGMRMQELYEATFGRGANGSVRYLSDNRVVLGHLENRVVVGYRENRVVVGYRENRVVVGYRENRVVVGYRENRVVVGHREIRVVVGYGENRLVIRHGCRQRPGTGVP